jgi:hypothetical protein
MAKGSLGSVGLGSLGGMHPRSLESLCHRPSGCCSVGLQTPSPEHPGRLAARLGGEMVFRQSSLWGRDGRISNITG